MPRLLSSPKSYGRRNLGLSASVFEGSSILSSGRFNVPSIVPRQSLQDGNRSSDEDYRYIDMGDCDQFCRHCGAYFWLNERVRSASTEHRPEYHACCGGGQIYMPPSRDPPGYGKPFHGSYKSL